MSIEKMSVQQIEASLTKFPDWQIKDNKLHRELKFKNFIQTWGFMTQVAILAEQMDHHPEWSNVYNQVTIDLTTHEADGISQRDFDLAGKINKILVDMVTSK